MEHYNILVIGKSGNGKSALCNTILGEEKFQTGRSLDATTLTAQCETTRRENAELTVVDTPDITNCGMDHAARSREVVKWKHWVMRGGTLVVLLVVRSDFRYTQEEFDIYQEIVRVWGDKTLLQKRLIVAFTFGDRQDDDIRAVVRNPPPELKKILKKAKDRYLIFINKKNADQDTQVRAMMNLIRQTSKSRQTSQSQTTDSSFSCGACVVL